jgi:trk system potassium uptake protein TrkA
VAHVAVIGLGRFGFHVARHAFLEGHEVLAVSNDPQSVQAIKEHSHRAVVVDATDRERLEALGLAEFDVVVVSLGERIDASAIIVLHLREMGARRIIAKANTPEHGRLLELIGAHEIVFPERAMAERLARRLHDRNLADFIPLGTEHALEEIAVPEEFAGRTLAELELPSTYDVQVLAVLGGDKPGVTVNPDPEAPLQRGGRLLVLGRNADLRRLPGAR